MFDSVLVKTQVAHLILIRFPKLIGLNLNLILLSRLHSFLLVDTLTMLVLIEGYYVVKLLLNSDSSLDEMKKVMFTDFFVSGFETESGSVDVCI